nr:amidase family protein [Bradyrhizobium diazoefficiens]
MPCSTAPTGNPFDLGRTPGGSSGGSSAALAAGYGMRAVGNTVTLAVAAALIGSGLSGRPDRNRNNFCPGGLAIPLAPEAADRRNLPFRKTSGLAGPDPRLPRNASHGGRGGPPGASVAPLPEQVGPGEAVAAAGLPFEVGWKNARSDPAGISQGRGARLTECQSGGAMTVPLTIKARDR